MRSRLALVGALGGAVVLAGLAGPAAAQVQQSNPDAANQSFGFQSQIRALNQQRVSDFNTLTMQAQRNVQFSPGPVYPGVAGGGVGRLGHGIRSGHGRGGLNTSICTGC